MTHSEGTESDMVGTGKGIIYADSYIYSGQIHSLTKNTLTI